MNDKVYIVSLHYNNPDFIELQHFCVKKYFKHHNFEFIVFNDAKELGDETNYHKTTHGIEIKKMADKLGIKCVNIPQEYHKNRDLAFPKIWSDVRKAIGGHNTKTLNGHPGSRHTVAIQFAFDYVRKLKDARYFFNMDADMFIVKNFDFSKLVGCNDLMSIKQSKLVGDTTYEYIWPNIVIINLQKCPDLDEFVWDSINLTISKIPFLITDTGGETGLYLKKHEDKIIHNSIPCRFVNKYSDDFVEFKEFIEKNIKLNGNGNANKEFIMNNRIIHLREAGSNWRGRTESYQQEQLSILKDFVYR